MQTPDEDLLYVERHAEFKLLTSRAQHEESVSTLCAINKPHGRFVYERWWARRRSELKQTQSRNAARSGFPLQNRERWPEAQGCAALVAGDMIWFSLISLLKLFLSLCLFSGCKSLKFQKQ